MLDVREDTVMDWCSPTVVANGAGIVGLQVMHNPLFFFGRHPSYLLVRREDVALEQVSQIVILPIHANVEGFLYPPCVRVKRHEL